MKSISAEDFQSDMGRYLAEVQNEAIVIVQGGRPCAVVHGVPDDVESAELAHSPEFWQMIEQRRKEPPVSWADARKGLGLD